MISRSYDLEERTLKFSENIIEFAKKVPETPVTLHLITQFVDAGTSIGANYCEANGASSKRDFKNKIYICKKEAKETKYFLRVIIKAVPHLKEEAITLWTEADELTKIFSKIISTMNKNKN